MRKLKLEVSGEWVKIFLVPLVTPSKVFLVVHLASESRGKTACRFKVWENFEVNFQRDFAKRFQNQISEWVCTHRVFFILSTLKAGDGLKKFVR